MISEDKLRISVIGEQSPDPVVVVGGTLTVPAGCRAWAVDARVYWLCGTSSANIDFDAAIGGFGDFILGAYYRLSFAAPGNFYLVIYAGGPQ